MVVDCSQKQGILRARSLEKVIMECTTGESRDLISDLPMSILHHVLSYVPYQDSVKTSVLSKRWNSVQKLYPVLEFHEPDDLEHLHAYSSEFKKRLGEFVDFVERSLHNFVQNKLCIKRMRLHVSRIDSGSVPRVYDWLPLVLHNGISDLYFSVGSKGSGDSDYSLPETTFAVNSSLLCGSSSKFSCLEKLSLFMVCLTDDMVSDIIRNCPNISHLFLGKICGLKTLNISKSKKLESLIVEEAQYCRAINSICIDSLTLEKFTLSFFDNFIPCAIDLTSCYNLRELKLCNNAIANDQFHQLIFKFPLLEVLDISCCPKLLQVTSSLPRLKDLVINRCHMAVKVEIDAPDLSSFDFTPDGESDMILFSSKVVPCSIFFNYEMHASQDRVSSWFLLLGAGLREFPSRPIYFCPRSDGIKVIFDDHDKAVTIPGFVQVSFLDLASLIVTDPFNLTNLLDGLLSSCHPAVVSLTASPLIDGDNCVNVLSKMLAQNECQSCCSVGACKSWHHCLKDARIKSINGIEICKFLCVSDKIVSFPPYSEVEFILDWDLSAIVDFPYDFLDKFSIRSEQPW